MSKIALQEGLEASVLCVTPETRPRLVREQAPLFCGAHRVGEYLVLPRRKAMRGLKAVQKDGKTFALGVFKGAGRQDEVREELVLHTACHDHPNIAKCRDFMSTPRANKTFVVFEHTDEGDLFDAVRDAGGRLNEFLALRYISQLLFAVRHVHERNMCHRSVRPEHVLVANDASRVLLTGFARAARWQPGDAPLPCDRATLRTLPPEVVQDPNSPVEDPRAVDVWGCGVVLFFLVTGRFPFGESNEASTARNILDNSVQCSLPDSVGPVIEELITLTMQRNPNKRATIFDLCKHPQVVRVFRCQST